MKALYLYSLLVACAEDPMAARKAAYEAKRAQPQIASLLQKSPQKKLTEPLAKGSWGFSSPQILSDPCNVNRFNQGLAKSVPTQLTISYPSTRSFSLSPEVKCTITGSTFRCSPMFREKEYMGAMIELSNTMSGTINNTNEIDLFFSVEILSCSNATIFCGGMDAALDLPCTVELRSAATKNNR